MKSGIQSGRENLAIYFSPLMYDTQEKQDQQREMTYALEPLYIVTTPKSRHLAPTTMNQTLE